MNETIESLEKDIENFRKGILSSSGLIDELKKTQEKLAAIPKDVSKIVDKKNNEQNDHFDNTIEGFKVDTINLVGEIKEETSSLCKEILLAKESTSGFKGEVDHAIANMKSSVDTVVAHIGGALGKYQEALDQVEAKNQELLDELSAKIENLEKTNDDKFADFSVQVFKRLTQLDININNGIENIQQANFQYHRVAAKDGKDKCSSYAVGFMFEKGIGINKNLTEAASWYFKAQQDSAFNPGLERAGKARARIKNSAVIAPDVYRRDS
ncbi:MAG: SEL1-like repeat protein [Lactobacillales bacterium]|jgi:ABC-type transporter Mla subunit MlaD|nr:SEL1-like repeat protein [Lactobacillales bacterium]